MIKQLQQIGFKKATAPETYWYKLNDFMNLIVWVKPAKVIRYSVFLEDFSQQKVYLEGISTIDQITALIKAFAK